MLTPRGRTSLVWMNVVLVSWTTGDLSNRAIAWSDGNGKWVVENILLKG